MDMRKILAIAVLIGCDNSPQAMNGADAAQTAVDLARAVDLAMRDMSSATAPDMAMAPMPDLSPAGDAMLPNVCGPNQLEDQGQCWDIATQAQCDALQRQYVPVGLGLVGYCGDCNLMTQPFFGYCAVPSCANEPGSLGALCQSLGRGCTAGGADGGTGTTAMCGKCNNTTAMLDPMTQACVPTTCGARSDCPEAAGFYCTQLKANDTPQCRKRTCPSGQSWDRAHQVCKDCSPCGVGGEWPVTDSQGVC
jgi:hypothetical protein